MPYGKKSHGSKFHAESAESPLIFNKNHFSFGKGLGARGKEQGARGLFYCLLVIGYWLLRAVSD